MARWLFPQSHFSPLVGVELPPIANMSFATFLGDKSLNALDDTNLVNGGVPFTVQGTGPNYSPNYGTFFVGNCLTTGMQDIVVGGVYPHTIVFAAAPGASNFFSTHMSFTSTQYTDSRIDSLPVAPNINLRTQAGAIFSGSASTDVSFSSTDINTWNLFAIVSVTTKTLKCYNLTTGALTIGGTIAAANRPSGGQWNIGCITSTYTNPAKMAFAMGANTEMSQADLNTLAAALRYPLTRRGIIV
jgi:hypothetical protein